MSRSTDPIPMLGLTSAQWIAQSGQAPSLALREYRDVFRRGAKAEGRCRVLCPEIGACAEENGTTKFALRFDDGLESESVIIPQRSRAGRLRNSLCVSSQIGCALGCTFCETARMGLLRNLSAEEIIAQWRTARFVLDRPVTNVMFMGMGEPLENADEVMQAIRVLADRNGPCIAPSRIAVSTVGRIAGIRRLAGLARTAGFHQLRLAVSVNAPNDEIRSAIMPLNRAEPMPSLMEAMLEWPTRGNARLLIEYVLIPGVNDRVEHADELCAYLRPLHCTVNVIPYNPRRDSPWPAPPEQAVRRFIERLELHGQLVRRRRTHGRQVMAACGQLGNPNVRRRRDAAATSLPVQ